MKADDLRLSELVDFGEGTIELKGRRLVLHSLNAFAQLRKDLVAVVGASEMRSILTRFGYFWGRADAAAMKRVFKWDSVAEWIKAGPRLHTLQGVVKSIIKSMDLDEAAGRFRMDLTWHHSGEAEEHLIEFGATDHPVCFMLVGYMSGYCSFCLGRDVYFIERKCRGKGDRLCSASGMDEASWGPELESHLPYFKAEDIKGKIEELTEALKRSSEELDRQRRALGVAGAPPAALFVEVRSESFRRALDVASRVAPFDTSVIVTGETGTGKEVLARHIHALSRRASGPFVAVNCGALPETLLESELFGHKAGAFTGATQDRTGLFEAARKGTIFLDEIGDVTQAMQLKLLRVLQEHEVLRLGETKPRKIDVRVIAATNRDLAREIAEGRFREDLYYRLRVVEIVVPPLRERKEDILSLARYFVGQLSKKLSLPRLRLDASCLDYLQEYPWPGNVRELENAIERAAVLSRDGVILPEYLPGRITHPAKGGALAADTQATLADAEARHIKRVLESVGGNRTRAAAILGISPSTLWRKLKSD